MRSLFRDALVEGQLCRGQHVVDASSGSTAIAEAWFARRLGLRYIAVVPADTTPGKLHEIMTLGGSVHATAPGIDPAVQAMALAERLGACFLDQFGRAARHRDGHEGNDIATAILGQLARRQRPPPDWIVCGAGTGGTSATIGRLLRQRSLATRLCVAEPSGMAFARGWRGEPADPAAATVIEGIGRSRVEAGFRFEVVDHVIEVDDAAACAGAHALAALLGRPVGSSTGCNLVACLELAATMQAGGERGSIVTLLCDRGERYAQTLFDRRWLAVRVPTHAAWRRGIEHALSVGGKPRPRP